MNEKKIIVIIVAICILAFVWIYIDTNEINKTLKDYPYYIVNYSIERVEYTGSGREYLCSILANGTSISYEFNRIKATRDVYIDVSIIEEDPYYNDSASTRLYINSHENNQVVGYLTVKEHGGYSNAGSYSKFRITVTLTGSHYANIYDEWIEEDRKREEAMNYDPYP